jgi:predicted type IV restriction endonuclease/GTPase SAR1 family protein
MKEAGIAQSLLERFDKLRLYEANEAETRLKLINRILFEVLDWTHDDVSVEEHVSEDGSTEYSDYVVRTGFSSFVIEAKKIGRSELNVPTRRKETLNRRLVSGETGEAITQARDYCRKLGIQFAVVTNGSQWIVFPALRTDGVRFEKSSAIIFPNLESALQEDLDEFYSLLSRSAVISGSLDNELLGRREDQIIERRLNQYIDQPFTKIKRNSVYQVIENEMETAFSEDITITDVDLFRKSYVETADRTKYDKRIGMHIHRRRSVTKVSPVKGMSSQGRLRVSESIRAAAARAKPVALLILGPVGAGKTTFIHYTRLVTNEAQFRKSEGNPYPHWIQIDFRNFGRSENASEFIFNQMFDYVLDDPFLADYERCVKHAYKSEISGLKKGPLALLSGDEREVNVRIAELLQADYNLKRPYVEKIIAYASQHSAIFLVLDNIDQFEDEQIQDDIFSNGIAISRRLSCNVILAMRDNTYFRNRGLPIFDAFDFEPINVEPPEVTSVLAKRFAIGKELLKDKPVQFTGEDGKSIFLEDASVIADLLIDSVLGTEVGNAISLLSTGDIRFSLRITRDFLRNGYSATGRAVQFYRKHGTYKLPPHEAMRAIMIGSRAVYSEEYSPIANPFDARLDMSSAQMLRLFLLRGLTSHASRMNFKAVSGEEIRRVFLEIGFAPDIALKVLEDLCRARFIFTVTHGPASFEATFIPSRLGGFVVRNLISNFVFVENSSMDTFIEDEAVWQDLRNQTEEVFRLMKTTDKIRKRVERVLLFFEHMAQRYSIISEEAARRGLSSEWLGNPLRDSEANLKANCDRIIRSSIVNYGDE